MPLPKPNYNPPFNITRASHSVLHVKDLAKSRAFYVDLIGLIVSDEDKDTIYLHGIAEACHHSLVLKRDGTVTVWGLNTADQCVVPAGLNNVVAIAARGSHSMVLIEDRPVRGPRKF